MRPPSRRELLCAALLAATGGCAAPAVERSRQAGIITPQQPYLLLRAFDFSPNGTVADLSSLLERWTAIQAQDHADLTITIATGPRMTTRLGLSTPDVQMNLPELPGDRINPDESGGELLLQLCGNDQTALATVADQLELTARGLTRLRWQQQGFLPPHRTDETPRNLLGFKDGTANPDQQKADRWVWLDDGPHRDGTFVVIRRIRMFTDSFARLPLASQERMLRRGYSYDDGPLDQGLIFLAYMRDPALFAKAQRRLASQDDLSSFVEHRASAVFFVLPGARPGRPLGASLTLPGVKA